MCGPQVIISTLLRDVEDKLLQEKYHWLKNLGPCTGECYENHICEECTDDLDDDYIYSRDQFMDGANFVDAVLITSMNFCMSRSIHHSSHQCNPP